MDQRDAGLQQAELGAAPERVAYIDGLRGIAAITVAWFHICANMTCRLF